MTSKDLGEKLKQLRRSKDMTIGELSEATGIATEILQRIERGESSPSTSTWLPRLLTGLGEKSSIENLLDIDSRKPEYHDRAKEIRDIQEIYHLRAQITELKAQLKEDRRSNGIAAFVLGAACCFGIMIPLVIFT